MSLPTLATLDDFEDGLPPVNGEPITLNDADAARAMVLLEQASTMVRTYTRRSWLDATGVTETFTPAVLHTEVWSTVAETTAEAARRVWLNPLGLTQEAIGSASASFSQWASGGMYLSASEKANLDRAVDLAAGTPNVRTGTVWAAPGYLHRKRHWQAPWCGY